MIINEKHIIENVFVNYYIILENKNVVTALHCRKYTNSRQDCSNSADIINDANSTLIRTLF